MQWASRKIKQRYCGKHPSVKSGPIRMQLICRATRGGTIEWLRSMATMGIKDIICNDLPDHIRHYGGRGDIEVGEILAKENDCWTFATDMGESSTKVVLSIPPLQGCLLIGEHYFVQAYDGIWTIKGIALAVRERMAYFVALEKVENKKQIFQLKQQSLQSNGLIITR